MHQRIITTNDYHELYLRWKIIKSRYSSIFIQEIDITLSIIV